MEVTINGEEFDLTFKPARTLLELLRDDLDLTGTKEGCDGGECGACTVLIDDEPRLACLTLAATLRGKKILTIEGLAKDGRLHPLQRAFLEKGAVQCGYCTPGVILSAKALLDSNPAPTEEDIKKALAGNLCRCTGYQKIISAVLEAAAAP
ncbi:MAG: (2Fe-2S)-binding protein [Deltaproteobacteria bacterium RIFCSPLOWO2_12_FULL_60_19]|nr:MAG: (2Fe-2S)-binding protein [Deltaproteobacteria bacterium RIFCSPLOWO2_12_FULL_60_19]